MNKTLSIITILLLVTTFPGESIAGRYGFLEPGDNEVAISYCCVEIPLKRILLIRKDEYYYALKFTRNWTEADEKEKKELDEHYVSKGIINDEKASKFYNKKYAAYEVYYQKDGSADFSKNNILKKENTASWFPPKGPFRPFIYNSGDVHVKCGPFKLSWEYKNIVCGVPSGKDCGEYGFELAPTPWTDIKDVNAKDPRIKWYRYDEKRERVVIPIDKLWKDVENKEAPKEENRTINE